MYCIITEYNSSRIKYNFSAKFYELEDNFNKQNLLDIYSHVVTNNDLNGIVNAIQINSTKIFICINLKSELDKFIFDNESDYSYDSDEFNNNDNDENN